MQNINFSSSPANIVDPTYLDFDGAISAYNIGVWDIVSVGSDSRSAANNAASNQSGYVNDPIDNVGISIDPRSSFFSTSLSDLNKFSENTLNTTVMSSPISMFLLENKRPNYGQLYPRRLI